MAKSACAHNKTDRENRVTLLSVATRAFIVDGRFYSIQLAGRAQPDRLLFEEQRMALTTVLEFYCNHFQFLIFPDFKKGLFSGSGPGGRRFKSSLPDHFKSIASGRFRESENRRCGRH